MCRFGEKLQLHVVEKRTIIKATVSPLALRTTKSSTCPPCIWTSAETKWKTVEPGLHATKISVSDTHTRMLNSPIWVGIHLVGTNCVRRDGHISSLTFNRLDTRERKDSAGSWHVCWNKTARCFMTCDPIQHDCNGLAIWPVAANPNRQFFPQQRLGKAPHNRATSEGWRCRLTGHEHSPITNVSFPGMRTPNNSRDCNLLSLRLTPATTWAILTLVTPRVQCCGHLLGGIKS